MPLAYGLIDSENDASWTWFFEQFREAHGLKDKMCVVSDRNESIIKTVLRMYNIPHYSCMFHLWNNVKTLYKKSHDSLFSEVFYAMTKAYKYSKFNELMKKVERVDIRVKNYLEFDSYDKWARVYATVDRGTVMTSNIVEHKCMPCGSKRITYI